MKKTRAGLALLISLVLTLGFSNASRATTDSSDAPDGRLEVYGVTLEWNPEEMWAPEGCSKFNFKYNNGSGIELLRLGFELTSQYGDSVAWDAEVGVEPGVYGTWNKQICSFHLEDGLGPYKIKLLIKDYAGSSRDVEGSLTFKAKPAVIKSLRAMPSTTQAKISWAVLQGADGYEIRISTNASGTKFGSWQTLDSKYLNAFTWTGMKRKTNYTVQVRAVTPYGYGQAATVKFKTR